jgi:4-amino-4-deoxy-L-arabinose transferase-like glycosyltransferase
MQRDISTPGETISSALNKLRENPVMFCIIPAIIFLLAFIPRAVDLGTGLTVDETLWLRRAPEFIDALLKGNYSGTYIAIHPGVTVMWLSGVFMKLFLQPGMDFSQSLSVARFPVVLITSLGIVLMFFLLRDLVPEKTAILASVLIALDPFYLAHSRFIHVDALVTTFMALSLLSFLVWVRQPQKSVYLVMVGGFLGCALLTKQPAESLIPFFLLALVIRQIVISYNRIRNLKKTCADCFSTPFFRSILKPFLTILVIAGVVFVLFWPAMWVAPVNTLQNVGAGLEKVVENPHEGWGYFMGVVTTTDNYGPLFYPVVLVMKLTPVSLVFFLVGLLGLLYSFYKSKFSDENLTVIFLLLFIALFYLLMTISEKKMDRYLLPVFPYIDILAAMGICVCYSFISRRISRTITSKYKGIFTKGRSYCVLVILVIILQAALIVPITPYYLSYSNPVVLGGPQHAPEYILVGWGEGMDLAAAYLNNKTDAEHLRVFEQYSGFQSYFKGSATRDVVKTDYIVFYSSMVQRHYNEDLWNLYRNETPEKVIVLNNIEYCWIYRTHLR